MRVNVTARDIQNGKAGSCDLCPVALALQRHKGFDHATVGTGTVWNGTAGFYLPRRAIRFVDGFDTGKRVRPFKFDLEVSR